MMEGISELLKKGREIQEKLKKALKEVRVEASSGAGMVKVVADGEQNIISLRIDPSIVSKEDTEMLQDLIIAAVNEAKKKVQEETKKKMKEIIGFPLPFNLKGIEDYLKLK